MPAAAAQASVAALSPRNSHCGRQFLCAADGQELCQWTQPRTLWTVQNAQILLQTSDSGTLWTTDSFENLTKAMNPLVQSRRPGEE